MPTFKLPKIFSRSASAKPGYFQRRRARNQAKNKAQQILDTLYSIDSKNFKKLRQIVLKHPTPDIFANLIQLSYAQNTLDTEWFFRNAKSLQTENLNPRYEALKAIKAVASNISQTELEAMGIYNIPFAPNKLEATIEMIKILKENGMLQGFGLNNFLKKTNQEALVGALKNPENQPWVFRKEIYTYVYLDPRPDTLCEILAYLNKNGMLLTQDWVQAISNKFRDSAHRTNLMSALSTLTAGDKKLDVAMVDMLLDLPPEKVATMAFYIRRLDFLPSVLPPNQCIAIYNEIAGLSTGEAEALVAKIVGIPIEAYPKFDPNYDAPDFSQLAVPDSIKTIFTEAYEQSCVDYCVQQLQRANPYNLSHLKEKIQSMPPQKQYEVAKIFNSVRYRPFIIRHYASEIISSPNPQAYVKALVMLSENQVLSPLVSNIVIKLLTANPNYDATNLSDTLAIHDKNLKIFNKYYGSIFEAPDPLEYLNALLKLKNVGILNEGDTVSKEERKINDILKAAFANQNKDYQSKLIINLTMLSVIKKPSLYRAAVALIESQLQQNQNNLDNIGSITSVLIKLQEHNIAGIDELTFKLLNTQEGPKQLMNLILILERSKIKIEPELISKLVKNAPEGNIANVMWSLEHVLAAYPHLFEPDPNKRDLLLGAIISNPYDKDRMADLNRHIQVLTGLGLLNLSEEEIIKLNTEVQKKHARSYLAHIVKEDAQVMKLIDSHPLLCAQALYQIYSASYIEPDSIPKNKAEYIYNTLKAVIDNPNPIAAIEALKPKILAPTPEPKPAHARAITPARKLSQAQSSTQAQASTSKSVESKKDTPEIPETPPVSPKRKKTN